MRLSIGVHFCLLWLLYQCCYALNASDIYTRFYLMQLWTQTGGPTWNAATLWFASANPCDWSGVSCCLYNAAARKLSYTIPARNGTARGAQVLPCQRELELMALSLSGCNLRGQLPPSIAELELERLLLADNPGLYGTLPRAVLEADNFILADVRNTSLTCDNTAAGTIVGGSGSGGSKGTAMGAACGLPARYAFGELGEVEAGGPGILPAGATYACARYTYRNRSSSAATQPSTTASDAAVVASETSASHSLIQPSASGMPAAAWPVATSLPPPGTAAATVATAATPAATAAASPTAVTLLLSSPSFWYYQSCVCVGLPGGQAAAAGQPTPSWSSSPDGSVFRATCRPNGGDGLLQTGIAPAVFGGALTAVGVATAAAAVVCTLYCWVPLLRRWRTWKRQRYDTAAAAAGDDVSGGRAGDARGSRGWLALAAAAAAAVVTRVPSSRDRSTSDSINVHEAVRSEGVDDEHVSARPRAMAARSKSSGLGGATATPQLRRTSGKGSLKPTATGSVATTPTRMDVKRASAPGIGAFNGQEVTLVATDVEGSTELWEWQPDIMNYALALHDRLMRLTIAACCGYEITTEGDAFLVAFHEPVDAVRWALMLQSALLKLDWPPLLLEHPLCRPRPLVPVAAAPQPSGTMTLTTGGGEGGGGGRNSTSAPLLVLFKGLSVRMGIATGVPSSVREHPVTRRMQYTGAVLRLATGIAELGYGGQILVEPITFKSIHNKIEELDVVEAEVQELADVLRHDTTIMGVGAGVGVGDPMKHRHPLLAEPAMDAEVPSPAQPHSLRPPLQQQEQPPPKGSSSTASPATITTTSTITGGDGRVAAGADPAPPLYMQPAAMPPPLQPQQQPNQQSQQQHNLRGGIPSGSLARLLPTYLSPLVGGGVHTCNLTKLTSQLSSPDGNSRVLVLPQRDAAGSPLPSGPGGTATTTQTAQSGLQAAAAAAAMAAAPAPHHGFTPNSSRLRRLADLAVPGGLVAGTGLGDWSGQSNRLPSWAPVWHFVNQRALMAMRVSPAPPASSQVNALDWNTTSNMGLPVSRNSIPSHIQTMSCSNGSRSGPSGGPGGGVSGGGMVEQLGRLGPGDLISNFFNNQGPSVAVIGSYHSGSMMPQRSNSLNGLAPLTTSPSGNVMDSSATFGGTWKADGTRQGFFGISRTADQAALVPAADPAAGLMHSGTDYEPSLGRALLHVRAERAPPAVKMGTAVVSTLQSERQSHCSCRSSQSPPAVTMATAAAAAAAVTAAGSTSTPSTLGENTTAGGGETHPAWPSADHTTKWLAKQPSPPPPLKARRCPGPLCEGVHRDDEDMADGALLLACSSGGATVTAAAAAAAAAAVTPIGGGSTLTRDPPATATKPALGNEVAGMDASVYAPPAASAAGAAAGTAPDLSACPPSVTHNMRGSVSSATLGLPRMCGAGGNGQQTEDSELQADDNEELYVVLVEGPRGWSGHGRSESAASNAVGVAGGVGSSSSNSQTHTLTDRKVSLSTSATTIAEPGRRLQPPPSSAVHEDTDKLRVVGVGAVGVGTETQPALANPDLPLSLQTLWPNVAMSHKVPQLHCHTPHILGGNVSEKHNGEGTPGSGNADSSGGGSGCQPVPFNQPSSMVAGTDSLGQDDDASGSHGGRGGSNFRAALQQATGGSVVGPALRTSVGFGSGVAAAAAIANMSTDTFGSWIVQHSDAAAAPSGRVSLEFQRLTRPSLEALAGFQVGTESMLHAEAGAGVTPTTTVDTNGGGASADASGTTGGGYLRGLHLFFKSAPQQRVARMKHAVSVEVCASPGTGHSRCSVVGATAEVPICITTDAVTAFQEAASQEVPRLPSTHMTMMSSTNEGSANSEGLVAQAACSERTPHSVAPSADSNTNRMAAAAPQRSALSWMTSRKRRVPLLEAPGGGGGGEETATEGTAIGGVSGSGCGSPGGTGGTAVASSLGASVGSAVDEFSFAFSRLDSHRGPSGAMAGAPSMLSTSAGGRLRGTVVAPGGAPAMPGMVVRSSSADRTGALFRSPPGGLRVADAAGALLSYDEPPLLRPRSLHSPNSVGSGGSTCAPERHRLASAAMAVEPPPLERAAVAVASATTTVNSRVLLEQGAGGSTGPQPGPHRTVSTAAGLHSSLPPLPAQLSSPARSREMKSPYPLSQDNCSINNNNNNNSNNNSCNNNNNNNLVEFRSMEEAMEGAGKAATAAASVTGAGWSSWLHPQQPLLAASYMARPNILGPTQLERTSATSPSALLPISEWVPTTTPASAAGEWNHRPGSGAFGQYPFHAAGAAGLMAQRATSSSSLGWQQWPSAPAATAAAAAPAGTGSSVVVSTAPRAEDGVLPHMLPGIVVQQSTSGDATYLTPSNGQEFSPHNTHNTMGLIGALQLLGQLGPAGSGSTAGPTHGSNLGGQSPLKPYQQQQQQHYPSQQHSHKLTPLAGPQGIPKVLALREMLPREARMTSVANYAAKQAKDLAEDGLDHHQLPPAESQPDGPKGRLAHSANHLALLIKGGSKSKSKSKSISRQHSGGSGTAWDIWPPRGRSSQGLVPPSLPITSRRTDASAELSTTGVSGAPPPTPSPLPGAASLPIPPHTATQLFRSRTGLAEVPLHRSSRRLSSEMTRNRSQHGEIELMGRSIATNCPSANREEASGGGAGGGGGGGGFLGTLTISMDSRDGGGGFPAPGSLGSCGSSPQFSHMVKRTRSRSALIKSLTLRHSNSHRSGLAASLKASSIAELGDESPRQVDVTAALKRAYHTHSCHIRQNGDEDGGPAADGAATAGYHPLVVIDMGVHSLAVPALDVMYGNLYDGVQVIQLLPAHLKHRAAYHPPLKSLAQLSPGFFDAPGAAQALLPRPPSQPPAFPRLSLMFIQPAGYSAVANANLEVAERSGAVFCAAVREVLQMYGAYECQEYECTFMAACSGPRVAAEAGLALQEWLLQADWPSDLLDEFESGRVVLGPSGRPLLRGFRAKVGIFTGVPLTVVPHATSGRADYFGAMVNRAARLMAGAKAGQILVDKNSGLEILREWRQMAVGAAAAANGSPELLGSEARSSRLISPPLLPAALRDPRLRGSSLGPFQALIDDHGSTNGSSLTHRHTGHTATTTGAVTGIGTIWRTSSSGAVTLAKATPPLPPAATLQLAPSWLLPTSLPGLDTASPRRHTGGGGGGDRPNPGSMLDNPENVGSSAATGAAAATASGLVPAAAAAMAAAAGKVSLLPRAVQVVDLGEFKLKGLSRSQPVLALQLRRIRGQPGDASTEQEDVASAQGGGGGGDGKAQQVQRGAGLIDEVAVVLAVPTMLLAACTEEDIDTA